MFPKYISGLNEMRCAICYHLYNFKNVQNTHWGVLFSVTLQAVATLNEKTSPVILRIIKSDEKEHPSLTLMKGQWKFRQQRDQHFPV